METNEMFYQSWGMLPHTAVAAALSFVVLGILLRFFGKKMLLTEKLLRDVFVCQRTDGSLPHL